MKDAWLHLEGGPSYRGRVDRDIPVTLWGEVAFTTGMTGYEETATDPSFLGQHLVYTTAHVGNYPSEPACRQSSTPGAMCLVARNFSPNAFFKDIPIPLVSHLDTRSLVQFVVNNPNAHKSALTHSPTPPSSETFARAHLSCNDLGAVSQRKVRVEREGPRPIALINYGMKQAILEEIKALGYPLVSFPHQAKAQEILAHEPRLIFLSNGPGDPRHYSGEVAVVRELLDSGLPIRGICLGHQLISLGLGANIIRLPFGQRGINHPVFDYQSGKILITSQNHGYATCEESFLDSCGKEFFISHRSLFDSSLEGLASYDGRIKSVQFHPEASPGPLDARGFFREIGTFLGDGGKSVEKKALFSCPKPGVSKEIAHRRVLLIGSGPIKIGQASEFDYSGTQACKALKEIGVEVILLNSNPATIMTDPQMAYRTYVEPITRESICRIIERENIDAVLSTMGGQTALNACVELEEEGYLGEKGVALLGATVSTIRKTEDRAIFARELEGLGYKSGKRFTASSKKEALELGRREVGFPLIIRRDFALGGTGALLIRSAGELEDLCEVDFPLTLERSLLGYKEVELEVMVDGEQNGVIVCSIENVDPCGVHTGDSITVAPVQTLSDRCYQKIRQMALRVATHMGVVAGGANVQFAINPRDEDDIVVIEMNPRVSRSSALASKATGYPIAKISALLALGYTLKEIQNDITGSSPVAFEPTQDYVSVKIPLFPFRKFPSSSQELGPAMRSVGEVLGIGSSFAEAFLKALRSLEMGLEIPRLPSLKGAATPEDRALLEERLRRPRELCLLTALEGLRRGMGVGEISSLSGITPWFIEQMNLIYKMEEELKNRPSLDGPTLRGAKNLGISDKHIALLRGQKEEDIFRQRKSLGLMPSFRAVDTCSGEFNARTPYFYSTYSSEIQEVSPLCPDSSHIILGAGPNRIGQGIEFDYSCVKSAERLREKSLKSIMVNSNPETVSTDYDISDRLYLAPLYPEDLFDIFSHESPRGIIACFSGQTGIDIREDMEEGFRAQDSVFPFLGPSLESIRLTEDRKKFAEVTKKVPLVHHPSREVVGLGNFLDAIAALGLPAIIRPNYVIGGESMYVFHNTEDLDNMPGTLLEKLKEKSLAFQVEPYLWGAQEYDVDLVRNEMDQTVMGICEHIEHAGVHSGDSGMITPPVLLKEETAKRMGDISASLARILGIVGPINFQYAVKGDCIYCIEANPRGSRTLPFLSKALGSSLPKMAVDAMLGEKLGKISPPFRSHWAVKQSTFPFDRFLDDSIVLGPKMRSTGETMGVDRSLEGALMKSYLGNYPGLRHPGKILLSLADPHKEVVTPYLGKLAAMGLEFYATRGTCNHIRNSGYACHYVGKLNEGGRTIVDVIREDHFVLVVNTPLNQGESFSDGEHIRNTAIECGIPTFTRPENIRALLTSLIKTNGVNLGPISLQEIHDVDGPR